MKKTLLISLAFFALTSVFAQQNLNDYKYIIIPNTFDFLKEADEYRLNSLTKFLFEKYNFEALMENDEVLPSDYSRNNCLGLKADVLKDSNVFKTKLSVQLKNCKNEVIYITSLGESREKSFKVAYNEALRNAFKSFEAEDYSYNPKNAIVVNEAIEVVEEKQVEIEKLKEEIKVLKEEKDLEVIEVPKSVSIKNEEILETKVLDNTLKAELISGSILNYLIKDSNGQVLYTLLYSGQQDLYIVKGKDAIVSKINNTWAITQYIENDLQIKALDLKF